MGFRFYRQRHVLPGANRMVGPQEAGFRVKDWTLPGVDLAAGTFRFRDASTGRMGECGGISGHLNLEMEPEEAKPIGYPTMTRSQLGSSSWLRSGQGAEV